MPVFYKLGSYVLFWLALPLLLTHPKLREGILERLGIYRRTFASRSGTSRGGPRIWLHGASAGDLLALEPILDRLRVARPDCTLIVSTLTNSGKLMARDRLRAADVVVFVPYDIPGAVQRAMAALRPDLLILEYTEIWPNLIWAAKRSGAQVALTNGRFSTKTLRSYRLLFTLIGNPLKVIDLFLMRGEEEAERALSLGAATARVFVTGNTKFDGRRATSLAVEGPSADLRAAIGEGGSLLIAGSTHDGEEELLFEALQKLRVDRPALRLVVAPRYIERANRLLGMAREWGFTVRLRSQVGAQAAVPRGTALPDVVILDTIGELVQAYRLATLVFVGGSFTSRGGQNILEPASAGKPVLFGPNMENFADSVKVLLGRGGIQVKDPEQLVRVVHDLLAKPELVAELGAMARVAVGTAHGASDRDVEHLLKLLEKRAA